MTYTKYNNRPHSPSGSYVGGEIEICLILCKKVSKRYIV